MITSHGFLSFIGAVAGFYMGVFWVDASATLELTQTRNQVTELHKRLEASGKTIEQLKSTNTKRENLVKDFSKNFEAIK